MKQQSRRSTVRSLIAATLLAIALAATSAFASAPKRPNIIVILADDLGFGDLGCYGGEDIRTPHVDGLARNGVRFTNFFANCCVCSPTRASLLTGRYPEMVGVPGVIRTHANDSWGDLSDDAVLLPQLLKSGGYRSTIVGKWHLGLEAPDRPQDRGFDVFRGFLGDMMDDYWNHRRHGINYMRSNDEVIHPEGHATDLFTKWAVETIRDHEPEDPPFFLYLSYNAPHTPIQPPPDWLSRVRGRAPEMSAKRAKLVALIEHMDDGIGQVISALRESRLEQSTLVVFTSDNGGQVNVGANNGPWRDGKQSVYEGGLRVACIASWPGKITPGTKSERIGITMDIFPTLLDAAGLDIPPKIEGVSFYPTLIGVDQPETPRDLFFCRREGNMRYGGKTIEAVRRGDWKLLQNSPWQPLELYNLHDDPGEQNNVIADYPTKLRELAAALRRQIQRYGAVPWQSPE